MSLAETIQYLAPGSIEPLEIQAVWYNGISEVSTEYGIKAEGVLIREGIRYRILEVCSVPDLRALRQLRVAIICE